MKKFTCAYCGKKIDRFVNQTIDPNVRVCTWCYPSLAHNGLYQIKVPPPKKALELITGMKSAIILLVSGNDRSYRSYKEETTPKFKWKTHHKRPVASTDLIKRTILKRTPSSPKARDDMQRIYDSFKNMSPMYEYRFAQNILTYYCLWRIRPEIFFNDYDTFIRNTIYETTRAISKREVAKKPKIRYMQINTYYVPVIHIEASGLIINNIVALYEPYLEKAIQDHIELLRIKNAIEAPIS